MSPGDGRVAGGAPAGTPAEITAKLNADFLEVIKLPDVRARMTDMGADPVGSTPAQFGEFIRTEIARYKKLAHERNISLDD